MRFLPRFQRLERSRREPGAARSATGERFGAIEPAAPAPRRSIPASWSGSRLRSSRRSSSRRSSDAQPFVRCPACGVDSAPGARRCQCGTALDTLEAVAFNAELWDRHRSEQAVHETLHQRAREADLEAASRLQQERRALGEAIAREIAARERAAGSGVSARFAGALLLLGFSALVLLPRGPLARLVFAVLLGTVAVRAVVVWARSRPAKPDPEDPSSADR